MSIFKKIVVVLGPTASGKSDLAVLLALRLRSGRASKYGYRDAEIISADSRQVYRGLDLGSGKVPRDIIRKTGSYPLVANGYYHQGVRHHLLDVASPKRTFTAAHYQRLARKAIQDIIRRGKLPIIVGGTGLYIDAALYGYPFPAIKPNPALRKKLERKTTQELFAQLSRLDPRRAASIDRRNRRRLVRALEIVLESGAPVPPPQKKKYSEALDDLGIKEGGVFKIGIRISPEALKRNIALRLRRRLARGMIAEVRKLRQTGVSSRKLEGLGLEYRYVNRFLEGKITRKAMIEAIERESVRYAKRQMTWWKRQKDIDWIQPPYLKKAQKLASEFIKIG